MSQIKLQPYLNFNGNTRDAMEFYHDVLGGKLDIQTFADGPDMPGNKTPDDYKNKVLHANLEVDGMVIQASDPMPGATITMGENMSLCFVGTDKNKLTKIFNGLAAGGAIHMPLAEQFWGDTFGLLKDKFGLHWMVNIEKEAK